MEVPAIVYEGPKILGFLREIIMLSVAFFLNKFADQRPQGDEFNFENQSGKWPLSFIGDFWYDDASTGAGRDISPAPEKDSFKSLTIRFIWGTGVLSCFWQMPPNYLNFLRRAMASKGASISNIEEVRMFCGKTGYHDFRKFEVLNGHLPIAFGILRSDDYIGNGPNSSW